MVGMYHTIPSLQGLRKDHKGHMDGDPNKGSKLRPLAAANKAPNAALGNLAARITKALGDNVSQKYGNELISTEQLKKGLKRQTKQYLTTGRETEIVLTSGVKGKGSETTSNTEEGQFNCDWYGHSGVISLFQEVYGKDSFIKSH